MTWQFDKRDYGRRAYGYVAGENSVKGPVSMILAILCGGFLAWQEYTEWEPFVAIAAINLPMLFAYFRVKKVERIARTNREEVLSNTEFTVQARDNARVAAESSVKAIEVMQEFDAKFGKQMQALDDKVKRMERLEREKAAIQGRSSHGSIQEEDL